MTTESWLRSHPWKDEEVFIIGGGSSLHHFDWDLLKNKYTIGCNDAYKLGESVCNVCMFGDYTWWTHHEKRLAEYKGIVVTNACALSMERPPWVGYFEREPTGLYRNSLGWNGNTGASAINLAIILGAKKIYLLGFDMGIVEGKTNWHDEVIHPNAVLPSSYLMFLERWQHVVNDLGKKFPNREVINVNDASKLAGIATISAKRFWRQENA